MKKTELKDVYCVPKTDEEWGQFKMWDESKIDAKDLFPCIIEIGNTKQCIQRGLNHENLIGRTEIPVSKFIDLLEDRMVGWRLEEIGFVHEVDVDFYILDLDDYRHIEWNSQEGVAYDDSVLNIKTFTELETLIRFLR